MIILSQNKMMLINFDNISGIVIRQNKQDNMWQLQCKANEENKRILGKYKTEERAKEVLKTISCRYEHSLHLLSSKSLSTQNIMDYDFIYEMPEK